MRPVGADARLREMQIYRIQNWKKFKTEDVNGSWNVTMHSLFLT